MKLTWNHAWNHATPVTGSTGIAGIWQQLSGWGQRMAHAVSIASPQVAAHEPQIRPISDAMGQCWWYAYDPASGQACYLESEDEALVWLEQLPYYR